MDFSKEIYLQARQIVDAWDFSLMRIKMQEPSHAGWSLERIDSAIEGYRKYMAITKALDGYQLVPNYEIDRIWHEHILDTRQYATDCVDLFGGFLHHYPYFGMRNETDSNSWQSASTLSGDFWLKIFGEPLYNDAETVMKCPQACPNGVTTFIQVPIKTIMKCPQACPNGVNNFVSPIEKNYVFTSSD